MRRLYQIHSCGSQGCHSSSVLMERKSFKYLIFMSAQFPPFWDTDIACHSYLRAVGGWGKEGCHDCASQYWGDWLLKDKLKSFNICIHPTTHILSLMSVLCLGWTQIMTASWHHFLGLSPPLFCSLVPKSFNIFFVNKKCSPWEVLLQVISPKQSYTEGRQTKASEGVLTLLETFLSVENPIYRLLE
jgi:hypothetical protein